MQPMTFRALALLAAASAITSCTGSSTGSGAGDSPVSATSTFSKSYGGPLHDAAEVVLNTADGGFVLLGTADAAERDFDVPGSSDFWLQKLDANGNVELSRTFGAHTVTPSETTWQRARPTPDGGVILTGRRTVSQLVMRAGGTPGETADAYVSDIDIAVASTLLANGAEVFVVKDDLDERAIPHDRLIEGVKPVPRSSLASIYDQFERVRQW